MQRLVSATLLAILACTGKPGDSARVTLADEPAGAHCPDGGVRIEAQSGSGPVTTAFACHGATGSAASVAVSDEPPGEHCAHGGKRVSTRVGAEPADESFVCNGAPGASVVAVPEARGEHCPSGGVRLVAGEETAFVCNGADGADGADGVNGRDVTVTVEPPGVHCRSGGFHLVSASGESWVCHGTGVSIAVTLEPAGEHCAAGGQRLDITDASDVVRTIWLCDGLAGAAAQVTVTDEPPGVHCPTGGRRLETASGGAQATTTWLCNGEDGVPAIAVSEPPGNHCEYGGVRITSGGGDQYVCNGAPGAPGSNGLDGQDVSVLDEPAGAHCTFGGVKIISASGTNYVCDGATGTLLQVNAGSDQVVTEADALVTLSGSATGAASLRWIQLAGPAVTLSTPRQASTTFVPPEVGQDTVLAFRLVATSGSVSESADVTVRVNRAYVVDAGADAIITAWAVVKLNGKAWTGATMHRWTQLSGPAVTLSDTGALAPTFVAPNAPGHPLVVMRLVASDATHSRSDDVNLLVNVAPGDPAPPIRVAAVGNPLRAIPVTDPDGDALAYTSTGAALPSWASLASDGTIAGSPGTNDVGTSTGHRIRASDGIAQAVTSDKFSLRVYEPVFAPAQPLPVQTGIQRIIDIDLDGRPDVVEPNGTKVIVLRNTTTPGASNATFEIRQQLDLASNPAIAGLIDLRVADLDGDGRSDVVAVGSTTAPFFNPYSTRLVLTPLANVNGNLQVQPATNLPQYGYGPGFGDFNGDGLLDLVYTQYDGSLEFLMNASVRNSHAIALRLVPMQVGTAVGAPAAGDVDGDGRDDVVVTSDSDLLVYSNRTYPGSADPTFATVQVSRSRPRTFQTMLVDVNGDHRLDFAATVIGDIAGSNQSMFVQLNDGHGGFSLPAYEPSCGRGGYFVMTAADLNGDGRPEFVADLTNSTTAAPFIANELIPGSSFGGFVGIPGNLSIIPAQVADMNADGLLDLISEKGVRMNETRLGEAIVPEASDEGVQSLSYGSGRLAIADFDADGRMDIAVGWRAIAFNDGHPREMPTWSVSENATYPTLAQSTALALDFNSDGMPDLVTTDSLNQGYECSMNLNSWSQGARAATNLFGGLVFCSSPAAVSAFAAYDANRDGVPDVALAATTHASVLSNSTPRGANVPYAFASSFVPLSTGALDVKTADLNADGVLDAAYVGPGGITLFLSQLDPSTGALSRVTTTLTQPTQLTAIAIADFDVDGRPDLAAAGATGVSVLLNRTAVGATTAQFTTASTFGSALTTPRLAAGDLNGDGKPDLVATNTGNSGLIVFLNTTTAGATAPTFSSPTTLSTAAPPTDLALADVNGDGRLDYVVTHDSPASFGVLLNTLP